LPRSKDADVSPVLGYICRNVTLDRLREAVRILFEWFSANLLNLEEYFDSVLMKSVYRSYKGSRKIDAGKVRGMAYLGLILYILFGEPKFNPDGVLSRENDMEIRKVLRKHFEKGGYFLKYSLRYLAVKAGDRDKRSGRINIEPYVYSLLGGEIFYYCTLKALINVSKKAVGLKEAVC
jgi:hypothetical protein